MGFNQSDATMGEYVKNVWENATPEDVALSQLSLELARLSEALRGKFEQPVYCIDVANIPAGVTAEEFIETWEKYTDRGQIIYLAL